MKKKFWLFLLVFVVISAVFVYVYQCRLGSREHQIRCMIKHHKDITPSLNLTTSQKTVNEVSKFINTDDVPDLIQLLADDDYQVCVAAATILTHFPKLAGHALLQQLFDIHSSCDGARAALEAIAKDNPDVAKAVSERLISTDISVYSAYLQCPQGKENCAQYILSEYNNQSDRLKILLAILAHSDDESLLKKYCQQPQGLKTLDDGMKLYDQYCQKLNSVK